MKRIPFKKYTSCGNNFVIVDATGTEGEGLLESEMSAFASRATSCAFGIGCDNLLVIQRCNETALQAIAQLRGYWETVPAASQADFLFRMFEPGGEEALCCGNGLMCIADYLYEYHGVAKAAVMTEIPLCRPSIRHIGRAALGGGSWANLGHPRRIPPELIEPGMCSAHNETMDVVGELALEFQPHELKPYSQASSLTLSGYLVFTGEPHFVIFPDQGFSIPELANPIFDAAAHRDKAAGADPGQQPSDFGSWLVHRIGTHINSQCRNIFPAGLNINFARSIGPAIIENRCFERGIDRETLACGTGSLAVAYVAQHLCASKSATTDILPLRCRWHEPDARIQVQYTRTGWLLTTRPTLLFEGHYRLEPEPVRAHPVLAVQSRQADRYFPSFRQRGNRAVFWSLYDQV